jgi:magnesium transporter
MPKFDPLPEGAFVAACAVGIDQNPSPRLLARPISFVVGQHYLLTVWHGDASIEGERLDAMFGEETELPEHSGAGLAHGVLDAVVDQHLPVMIRAAEIAEDLDDLLDPQNERKSLAPLEELIVLRRDLLAFRRIGVAQQEVLRRLGRRFPSLHSYLSDVADNQREAIDTATATCDYIDGAIEAFRVGREARTGFRLRQLTVLAAIFGPLSLVTALWGLNFSNIPGVESAAGWYVFVAIQLLYVLSAVVYFRLRGLL